MNKATSFVENKTGTDVSIGRLFITFSGNIFIEDLYLGDLNSDTLFSSKNLEAGIGIAEFINSGTIRVKKLNWEGVTARVRRDEASGKFNFDFLTEAFASDTIPSQELQENSSDQPIILSIESAALKDFDLSYKDEVAGMDAELKIGEFLFSIPLADLGSFNFEVGKISLKDSQISYFQSKPFAVEEEDLDSPLVQPLLKLEELLLNNISLDYKNLPDQQEAKVNLGQLLVQLPEGNIRDQIIRLTKIELSNSSIAWKDLGEASGSVEENPIEPAVFSWPDWDVIVEKFTIDSTNLSYQTSDNLGLRNEFNPEFIQLTALTLDAEKILLRPNLASAQLNSLTFREGSGFELKRFNFDLALQNQSLDLNNFLLRTNRSQLIAEGKVTFASIADFITKPEDSQLNLTVSPSTLDLRDAFFFSRALEQDTLIRELVKSPFAIQSNLSGSAAEMNVRQLSVGWSDTRLNASGKLRNALDTDNLSFDFPSILMSSTRSDLIHFVKEDELGVKLPENLAIQTSLVGNLEKMNSEAELTSSFGSINLSGMFQNQEQLAFRADVDGFNLLIGELLQNPNLDTLSFSLKASGSGNDLYSMDAKLETSFEKLGVNGIDLSGLNLDGQLQKGIGQLSMGLKQEYLDFDMLADISLDSIRSLVGLNLDLKGADFYKLGLTEKTSRARVKLEANFDGNLESFTANARLFDGTIVYENKSYLTGEVDLRTILGPDTTGAIINSKLLMGDFGSNSSPEELQTALISVLSQYLDPLGGGRDSSSQSDVRFHLNLTLVDDPLLSEVLLQGLESFDSASVKVDFIESENFLKAAVDFPYIIYGGTEVDSLRIRIDANENDLNFRFGFLGLTTGPIQMEQTGFTGVLDNSRLKLDFLVYEAGEIFTHIPFDVGLSRDTVQVHLSEEDLLFNGVSWTIPDSNGILYTENSLQFKDFVLQNGEQSLSIQHDVEGFTEKNIATEFSNFQLETFTRILNAQDTLASGSLDGILVVENPFGATGILGELSIEDLHVLNTLLGKLDLTAEAKGGGNYQLDLTLKDKGLDLELEGAFVANEAGGELDLLLDLRQMDVEKIASLSQGQLQNGKGQLSGKVTVNGTVTEPVYKGEFLFSDASIFPTQLSTAYLLSEETIRIDNEGVYLEQFTIRDQENNTFIIDGKISTEELINPTFDLSINAKNFMAINSDNTENELVYGRAVMDADITVKGNLNLPVVAGNLRVRDRTDITLIIPETELDIINREGVVVFVNKTNPDDILTRSIDQTSSNFAGYSIQAGLQVDPKAKFKIIIDPTSGDNLTISGDSDLRLDINPNGRITLSGVYEVKSGSYQMSLYNLISKDFTIYEGSRITWNGDPLDATLDIRAIYKVETSASGLMASQLTGASSELQSQYQQRLDFLVYLNVKGDLLKPEITFSLDMPETARGSLGGNVYSRILQLNEQEDELNKQVFSLLVMDRFFPSQGSDGSGGGAEGIARNSASQLLSDQMNALSGKLFGDSGFSLGFGVDSYQDFQSGSGRNRTDLNVNAQQKLFNDRLVVQVGSQMDLEGGSQDADQNNSILANISLEYMLTEDGQWRIRAFRKNEFQSIIDGQLFVTGMGLIFNREFNEFKDLWVKTKIEPDIPVKEKDKSGSNEN
ncbi:translocation/assembly module TamB domain-containing protein [Algoriphagus sp.]|uniref:translocation/assembly module TamB domain-containing protein n=1 Tax=Algoriphagus sp. TaxID=1872435 RepID=UPI00391D3457